LRLGHLEKLILQNILGMKIREREESACVMTLRDKLSREASR